ncbi:MAG: exodeoxyribonuclease VII small subunit [Candidatus Methylacidiphilales bacterium]|nr:exodeoxyribonuclease VII small subunit [Candidatus Methylacidiphilales bacterium]
MPKPPAKDKSADITFEQAVARLDELVGLMQSPELPLEDLIGRYEEGMKLLGLCSEKLAAAEQKIELLTRQKSGTFTASPGGLPAIQGEDQPAPAEEDSAGEARLF